MAEIKDAGKAGLRAYVARTDDAKKLPPAEAGTGLPGEIAIGKDEFRIKKIVWSPEDRARFRLNRAESQIDRNLEAIDQAIAERTNGSPWMKHFAHFSDPELADLRRARSELLKAKKDVEAAKQALDGKFPVWKMAQAYIEPGIWRKTQPDLAEAEARLNSALGRLAHAEHCVQEAIEHNSGRDITFYKKDAESAEGAKAGEAALKCPGHIPGPQSNGDLKRLLHDIRQTRESLEAARKDVWEAQEQQRQPQPWPLPIPHPDPKPPRPWPPFFQERPLYVKDAQPDDSVI